jgi:hypothetical protein
LRIQTDDKLAKQMREREYVMKNNQGNRRALVSKEELRLHGKDSPDRLDTLLMMFSTHKLSRQADRMLQSNGICPTTKEALQPAEDEMASMFSGGWGNAE